MARYDQSLLQAALVGYEHKKEQTETAIADIRRRIGNGGTAAVGRRKKAYDAPARKKHRISAEGSSANCRGAVQALGSGEEEFVTPRPVPSDGWSSPTGELFRGCAANS
jgi:hypothetical protein